MKNKTITAVGAAILLCVGALIVISLSRTVIVAKRKAPPPIKPVIIADVEYRVPNTIETEGVVEAWTTNPSRLLWKQSIYSTWKYPPFLKETDVQLVFITNMVTGPANNELTIADEKGNQYILNTTSHKTTRK